MQQKFSQNTSVMPPTMPQVGAISSMPPVLSHLPPPPPNQPAPLPPPPPENEGFQASNHSKDPLNQRPFQAVTASGSISRSSNLFSQAPPINQQFNRGGVSQSPNPFSGHLGRNQPVNSPSNDLVSKPSHQIPEEVTDKTPEEKAFDEQFKKWEEEFTNWKLQNANHPDTRAYLEYEQKMEECRTKLLERREQMKRRKLELLQQQQKQQQQQSQQPVQATAISVEQTTVSGYSHSSGSLEQNNPMEKVGNSDLLDNSSNNQSHLFMRGSASGSGIPGLDLVVDKPNDESDADVKNDTVIINDVSPDKASSHQPTNLQQRPDLEAISRGLTSILGDPNLASLLSNFQPKSIPTPPIKSAIPSLLDMKMPDIDMDNVPQFNWNDEDQDSLSSSHHGNDLSTNAQSNENENTQPNSNRDEEPYDDDFDREHERFAEMNQDDSNNDDRPFQMNRGGEDGNNFRDNFNRNTPNFMNGNETGDRNMFSNTPNFMNGNETGDNFNKNRSNFMNDNQNRMNFSNNNFNQNRSNFNENARGNNSFGGNAGNFNQQNEFGSFNMQGNRGMNPFDKPPFGNNSNFNNDRNQQSNNFQQSANFNGNFGNNFNRSMVNESNECKPRNDDRNNSLNDFCRRRTDLDGPTFDNSSNSQFPLNFRNNSRSDDNNQNTSQQFNSIQSRGLPTDSFISDNAKDEDFFRPTKVIDYSANSKNPTQLTTNSPLTTDMLMPTKVVDYGHQTLGIVSRPQNPSHPRPANKYTGGDFFPVKTIDYNHSSNKHMIKEYYYSIVSKWDPTTSNKSLQQPQPSVPHKSISEGSSYVQPIQQRTQPPQHTKTKELKEITYEQLSAINTATRQGQKMKRALIMKVSTTFSVWYFVSFCAR